MKTSKKVNKHHDKKNSINREKNTISITAEHDKNDNNLKRQSRAIWNKKNLCSI